MKIKLKKVLPCIVIMLFCTFLQYNHVMAGYEQLLSGTGISYKDFESELKKENNKVIQKEKEYQFLLEEESNSDKENQAESSKNVTVEAPRLNAVSALLLDASNNRVLYEKNGFKQLAMASTTKIMTCVVALENAKSEDIVTISAYAARMPDVQLNVKPKEQYYLKDLLYSLMLESHNDVAVAIAEHVGGSVEGFAAMMNAKAKEIGCNNTNFVTPNGLDAQDHYTTARDLAVIASYAISNKDFIAITNTSSHSFHEVSNKRSFTVTNKNRFLYMMDGAIGVKTGFTNNAGYCFVGAIKRPDRTLVSVVLGCGWPPSKSLKWSDTKELMSYGIKNYKEKQIYEPVDLEPAYVVKGKQRWEEFSMEGDLTLLLRDDETIKIEYDIPQVLKAPVKAEAIVGHAKYYIDDMLYAEIPIYTTEEIEKINLKYCFMELVKLWSGIN